METAYRPRRSVLYMPGSNARALEKARGLPADALILDLEDAVAPDAKEDARALVADTVRAAPYGRREVIVRVNAPDTPWGADDMAAAAEAAPDAILVPKVETADAVQSAAARLEAHGAPAATRLWAMVETPRAVLNADAIAGASERLDCLVMGTNDLVNELRAEHTADRAPVAPALALCVLAARANGLAILDGVHNAIRDEEGLGAICAQARALGFDGKTLIHPSQVAAANAAFAPSEDDLALARRYLAAFEEAEREGRGVAVVDDRLVENLHVANARRLIAMAESIAALEAANATEGPA